MSARQASILDYPNITPWPIPILQMLLRSDPLENRYHSVKIAFCEFAGVGQ